MDIEQYFQLLKRSIQRNPQISYVQAPVLFQKFDDYRGRIKARIFFWDSSSLNIEEVVDTEAGFPHKTGYSYTSLQNEVHIFRYDNAPHFPQFSTFPHHKHVGASERPEPANEPTLNQVFREIDLILDQGG